MITEQLKKSVQMIHSKNYEYKTAIKGSKPHLYLVVTRVNYITAQLWLNNRHKVVKMPQKGFIELPTKPNWLVMAKSFRRDEDQRIKELQML
jgi:hypothetical protein